MGVLRDNKAILKKIEKQMQFFKEVMLVGDVRHLCTLSWFAFNKSIYNNYLSLKIVIPKNAFQWVEDGDTLYYCVDLRKVLSYNNITGFILDNILETDLGNALENGIDNLYDSLCRRGTNFSLDEVKTFIKDVATPVEVGLSLSDLYNDRVIRNRFVTALNRATVSSLTEYIESCLDINKVYSNQESFNGQGNLKYIFYKNGCLAVARVDFKDDRVVFPNYGLLPQCSLNKDIKKKDSVIYYSISDVMNKGYTSNSGSNLVLLVDTKNKMRVDLSKNHNCWVETRS